MDESGISLSFDAEFVNTVFDELFTQVGSPNDLPDMEYYELLSKPPPVSESPTIKTEMAKSRTQLRQQLMRDQELQERKKAEEAAKVTKPNTDPVRVPIAIPNVEVPQHVLQVTTGLQNPTKYHIIAKQQNQVIQYLSSSQRQEHAFQNICKKTEGVHSAPILNGAKTRQKYDNYSSYTTMPTSDLLSPGLNSVATSAGTSDAEEVLEDILSFEEGSLVSENAVDSKFHTQSLLGSNLSIEVPQNKNSSSCPSGLNYKQEVQGYGDDPKERLKKDTHNMIERRRRYNINDRIKELGDLLPKTNDPHYDLVRDSRQNKGAILKSSVDYMKLLIQDLNKMKQYAIDYKQLEVKNRKLLLRIQELERQAQENGLPVKNSTWKVTTPEAIFDRFIRVQPQRRNFMFQKIPDVVCEANEANMVQVDDMMEEENIIRKDTMLCSPVSLKSSDSGSHFYEEDIDMNSSS